MKLILKTINDDIRIKQFNQFDNTSKDNISSNFRNSENANVNSVIHENVVLNTTNSSIEDFTKTENLNDMVSYNGENNIDLNNDSTVGCNNVMIDNSDINSIISEVTMSNEITQEDIGKRVAVEGYESIGTLRFYGPHAVKKSMRCGVEFDEPVGKHNGTIYGHEYFKSVENRGILVIPRKVTIIDNDNITTKEILAVNEINDEDEDVENYEQENVVNENEQTVNENEQTVNEHEQTVNEEEGEVKGELEREEKMEEEGKGEGEGEEGDGENQQDVNKYLNFIKNNNDV